MSKLQVPIPKAGKEAFLEVDTDVIPADMYALAMMEGLKVLLNARMTSKAGPGAVTKLSGDELVAAQGRAMKIAQENLDKLNHGTVKAKATKAKTSGADREVNTEARRIGRELVKNEIRKAGLKPSNVSLKEITAAADAMIAGDPSIIAKAKENLASRADLHSEIDLSKFVDIGKAQTKDAEAKAKAAKAKADKPPLSSKQAGIVAKRKPGGGASAAVH